MTKKSKVIQIISIILCLSLLAGVSASDINTYRESNKDTMSSESECMQNGNGTLDNDKTNRTQNSGTAKDAELPGNSGNNTGNSADGLTDSEMGDKWANRSKAPTVDTMLDTSKAQERWLSIPDSRLVINPFSFSEGKNSNKLQSEVLNSPLLPLHVGYLDPRLHNVDGKGMNDSVILFEKNADSGEKAWGEDFQKTGWQLTNPAEASLSFLDEKMILGVKSIAKIPWQSAVALLPIAVDSNTRLSITVAETTGAWSLKINTGSSEDIEIKGDSCDTGTYYFDLKDYVGTGTVNAKVVLYAIGKGSHVTVEELVVTNGNGRINEASEYKTSWQPHKLNFTANYPGGNKITGEDFFYDEKTIVRTVSVKGKNKMLIGGRLYGKPSILGNTITVTDSTKHKYMIVAITVEDAKNIKLYSSMSAIKAGKEGGTEYWGVEVTPNNGKIVISYALDTKELSSVSNVQTMSKNPIKKGDYAAKLLTRKKEWNQFLAKVPRTGDVNFTQIDAKGVKPSAVREMYYEAWCLMHASILPPNPELGFNYRQMATGKPAMWGYGDPKASYSAQWDSVYGMQMYSYINPDIAWDCFIGMMSLVDMTPGTKTYGMISGESLPNMTSRTAWILYQNKPDKKKLENVYDELNQHQKWCMQHPCWIYLDVANDLDSAVKDTDFTSAILVDIPYLIKIAEELGKTSDVIYWKKEFSKFLENFYKWHGGSYGGWTLWFTKALYIPELKKSFDEKLYRELLDDFDIRKTFCGFGGVKLEEIMYTIYGLMDNGYTTEAYALAESSVRDVVRAQFIAEAYTSDDKPAASGVRPSMFGAIQLIDSVWILNGFRYDSGTPRTHTLFGGGYIENLHVNGKIFNAESVSN